MDYTTSMKSSVLENRQSGNDTWSENGYFEHSMASLV